MGLDVRIVADQTAAQAEPLRPQAGALHVVWRAMLKNRKAMAGAVILSIFVLVALVPGILAPFDPHAQIFEQTLPPSREHLLGTTGNGQDIFSQLIWGTRESLAIAIVAGLMATVLSVLVGVSSAYLGGLGDHVLSLLTDVFLVVPTLPLMIVLAAYFRGGGLAVLIVVIVITGWSYGARQLRSQALSLRNRDFLDAARVRGERSLYVIVFEILPTMTSLIVANFLGAALYAVLAAAGLQFIGLGNPNDMSWGTMLFWAQNNGALNAGSPLWAIVPGLCIALVGAAFALLNYAFDEITNPALRPVRKRR
ncbi:MAG TPA: ABC transporter permease [Candidatus Angelobacter sp.]|nr:ABC transporter permease [Candidatus Angelobacter sp.]